MKIRIIQLITILMICLSFIYGCSKRSRYERKLKHELASGIRNDSLFMGLYLGMPQKDFYMQCWELNRLGLVKQGPDNKTVEYQLKTELKHPALMNFYPGFADGRISEMPIRFIYSGWTPWNTKLSSDSLQVDVLRWFRIMYGNDYMKVDHPEQGSAYVKLDGNRRITIFREDEMYVWAVISDMSVIKEIADTSATADTSVNIMELK